ncbi:MAG: hypothetical protein ABI068_14435 [Ktedonobacterales bacterium]
MSVILQLHTVFVWPLIIIASLALICGIVYYIQRRRVADSESGASSSLALIRRSFRILLITTATFGLLQCIWGALLFANGARPGDQLHYVYGAIVLLAIPVAYVYSDQKRIRRDILIMGIGLILVIGAAVRAFMTGPTVLPK